jgi:23S rRNA pseudouridine1911/1915/1917 synthase
MYDQLFTITITKEDRENFKRLDLYLTNTLSEYSRTFIKQLYENDLLSWNEKSPFQGKLELKKMPPESSIIDIEVPPPAPSEAIPENIPLDILYEDEHLLLVNKVAGMVTHPAPGHPCGTLVNAVLHHCPDLTGIGDKKRPGIVHRLDKGTSGVMVVAKTHKCNEGLVLLFSKHDITRQYQAILCKEKIHSEGTIESTIGRDPNNRIKMAANVPNSKKAITHYKVLKFYNDHSHVQFQLETGRTHQIRVHASSILKAPILCDQTYGTPKEQLRRLPSNFRPLLSQYEHPLLHAKHLGFVHPITKEELSFTVPAPKIFQDTINLFEKNL